MFIVPCKYTGGRMVFECVEAIQKYHPDERIVVVDSDSYDAGYYLSVLKLDYQVEVIEARNVNYATNAYKIAYEAYPDEKFYYCIQDSLVIQKNLSYIEINPFTAVRYFNTPPTGWGWDSNGLGLEVWAKHQLRRIGIDMPYSFTGVFGPMWMCNNKCMQDLVSIGFFNILPEDKYQLCAMERIAGIVLGELGYNLYNSFQGEMINFHDEYDQTYVQKIHLSRM